MKFTLTINCDNAAFTDEETGAPYPAPEIARLLRVAAERVETYYRENGPLVDYNGNTVGRFELTEQ